MKIFLIAYGILALVSFFLFTAAAEINAKETNSAVWYEMVSVSLTKLLLMALCFPAVWMKFIIHTIVYRE